MAFPKRASAESAIHVGNQFISNRKSTRRIESRRQRCLWSHIWFLGCCPRLIHETASFGAKQIPGLWSALIGNSVRGVIFVEEIIKKSTSSSRSRHRDCLRLRRFNWPDYVHHGSHDERSSWHSRQFTMCNCSHRTLLGLPV